MLIFICLVLEAGNGFRAIKRSFLKNEPLTPASLLLVH
jgi:hypothetical protein